MADIPGIQPSGVDPIRSKPEDDGKAKPQRTSTDGPAFHVLLERLQARAQELEKSSPNVNDPERLAGAVDSARESLEDALSLSDQILEAYHEAQQQTPSSSEPDEDPADGER